ncbi:MAG: acyltransferase [Treponema sp.]|nr:acyltransferase [Candidatus Treponema merdequi]
MKHLIKKILIKLKLIKPQKQPYELQKNLAYGNNTHFISPTFQTPYDNSIKIGDDCIIGCNFIFESNQGQITIGNRCFINNGTSLISRSHIEIGDDVTIAWGCTIYDHNSHSLDWKERQKDLYDELECINKNVSMLKNKNWNSVKSKKIKICDKAWIGFGCTILNGVTIGEGAVIGAQSVVREDIPPYSVAVGNPAKVIKKISTK